MHMIKKNVSFLIMNILLYDIFLYHQYLIDRYYSIEKITYNITFKFQLKEPVLLSKKRFTALPYTRFSDEVEPTF